MVLEFPIMQRPFSVPQRPINPDTLETRKYLEDQLFQKKNAYERRLNATFNPSFVAVTPDQIFSQRKETLIPLEQQY